MRPTPHHTPPKNTALLTRLALACVGLLVLLLPLPALAEPAALEGVCTPPDAAVTLLERHSVAHPEPASAPSASTPAPISGWTPSFTPLSWSPVTAPVNVALTDATAPARPTTKHDAPARQTKHDPRSARHVAKAGPTLRGWDSLAEAELALAGGGYGMTCEGGQSCSPTLMQLAEAALTPAPAREAPPAGPTCYPWDPTCFLDNGSLPPSHALELMHGPWIRIARAEALPPVTLPLAAHDDAPARRNPHIDHLHGRRHVATVDRPPRA